jgi:uncharacterized protein
LGRNTRTNEERAAGMGLREEFRAMTIRLGESFVFPPIAGVFFPPLYPGGQPRHAEFMALCLEDGSAGVSYVLIDETLRGGYERLGADELAGRCPVEVARNFGSRDPIQNMLGLAALNAMCRHVMGVTGFRPDPAPDSLGLLDVCQGDRIGMVGLFAKLIPRIEEAGAECVVLELNERLIEQYPRYRITTDPAVLRACNKVLCTSVTVFNNTLDGILSSCAPDTEVAVVGPTAGYFPDTLFKRGVTTVGGTYISDGALFMGLIAAGQRWGPATRKCCFRRASYRGIPAVPQNPTGS